MRRLAVFLLLSASLAFPARRPKPPAYRSVTIHAPSSVVHSAVLAEVVRQGFGVESDTPSSITVRKKTGAGVNFMTRAMLGNSYSEDPYWVMHFTLVENGGLTELNGQYEETMRQAYGNVEHVDLTNGKRSGPDFQQLLDRVRTIAEANSLAAAPAAQKPSFGINAMDSEAGVLVIKVFPQSAANQAGLRTGDIIFLLDGTAVKTTADVRALLINEKFGETIKVAFSRQGDKKEGSGTIVPIVPN